jgi:1-acyl-sn-glycerol-3-phosphate acyltransferase
MPALLDGTYEALPPEAKWIRLRPIRVVFGAPMDFSPELKGATEETKKVVYQQISQEIMDRIAELRDEESRTLPVRQQLTL